MSRPRAILTQMLRHYSPLIRARGRTMRHFAAKVGMVYFGTVDQHEDEHEVIRGLTMSTTHKDTHYAVGAFNGYDVSLVDRFDIYQDAHHAPVQHSWIILQVALEDRSLPHIFFKPIGHSPAAYSKFFTAYHHLHPINDQFESTHSGEFHARYELYSHAANTSDIEAVLSNTVTQIIAARFWPHAIEILEGKLYVYITEHRRPELEAMLGSTLEASTWLAGVLNKTQE